MTVEYYPVTLYHWDGRFIVCGSPAHKEAMGKGWAVSQSAAMAEHQEEIRIASLPTEEVVKKRTKKEAACL